MTALPSSLLARIVLFLASMFCGAGISMAKTPPEPEAPFEAAAECVAVLKQDLKPRLHATPTAQESDAWRRQTESAFAHAGEAYHAGVSEEQAQRMLDRAEARVAAWSASKVSRQAGICLRDGHRLLELATPVDKLIVRNAAKRWLARQLRKLQT